MIYCFTTAALVCTSSAVDDNLFHSPYKRKRTVILFVYEMHFRVLAAECDSFVVPNLLAGAKSADFGTTKSQTGPQWLPINTELLNFWSM